MHSQMTIGKKLVLCFAAMLVAMFALGYSSWSSTGRLGSLLDTAVNKTATKLVLSGDLGKTLSDMASQERAIAFRAALKDATRVAQHAQIFDQELLQADNDLKALRPLLVVEAGRQAADTAQASLPAWRTAHKELLDACATDRKLSVVASVLADKIVPIETTAQQSVEKLVQIQKDLDQAAAVKAGDDTSSAHWMMFALLGLCLVVGAVALLVVRQVVQVLQRIAVGMAEGAEQVASASIQVSSASQSLAQGASEQAASLEETSSSSEEISSMTRKNAENSKVAAEFTAQVDQRVTAANESLSQMWTSMNEIKGSSEKVSKIIKVIDEIAFQTNILALNAAVEAARAGEAGMGFAVVADEVRSLAQRCAQAAKDTASLIEESVSKSNDGIGKLDQVVEAIGSITESATKVKTLVDEVNLGSQEQARGIEQIAKAISQMEQVTQKNAANAEETASASEELSGQAETMKSVAVELQSLVGGVEHRVGGGRKSGQPARPRPATQHLAANSAGHNRSLKALQSAVSGKHSSREEEREPVAAGRLDRSAIPMDDDFKEF